MLAFLISAVLAQASSVSPKGDAEPCRQGMVRSVDTKGRCCWPKQVWSESKARCFGPPQCPQTFIRDALDSCVCETGKVLSEGRCCWQGQEWSQLQGKCIGEPSCPSDMVVDGNRCSTRTEMVEKCKAACEVSASRVEVECQATADRCMERRIVKDADCLDSLDRCSARTSTERRRCLATCNQ